MRYDKGNIEAWEGGMRGGGKGKDGGRGFVILQKLEGQQLRVLPRWRQKQACAAAFNAARMMYVCRPTEACMDLKVLDTLHSACHNSGQSDDTTVVSQLGASVQLHGSCQPCADLDKVRLAVNQSGSRRKASSCGKKKGPR